MWHWEEIDANRSGSSGDLAKLFKNEGVKQPGVLGVDAPSADATLLAREVIQNSWDAARELHTQFAGEGREIPEFRIQFEFRDLIGDDKARFIEAIALRELSGRAAGLDRTQLGLAEHDVLDNLEGDDPIRVLFITEQATTGMYGPFVGARSKLYLALVSIGFTAKEEGAGGSYGYGKAGLIRGSATRTVVAYSCFRERTDDPGVTRRLLGMTYWGLHGTDETQYTGFARFGDDSDAPNVVPFDNEQADAHAEALGLERRSPESVEELGTTFVLVQPTVEPDEVCAAIERNWWPAIKDQQFTAEVVTPDGALLFPRPMKNPVLKTFIEAWDVATVPQDNAVANQYVRTFDSLALPSGERARLGKVGLVADPSDWTYPPGITVDEEGESVEQVDHRSLVALVRGPRMVVEYLDVGRAPPYVRGAFVADEDVDDLLRQTEPKAHDAWEPRSSEEGGDGIVPDAPRVADAVLKRVRSAALAFRRALRPPPPAPQDIRLPVLEDLFKQLITGRGRNPKPPKAEPRLLRIHMLEQVVEPAANDSQIRLRARVGFALSENYVGADEVGVELGLRFAFLEDLGAGERCALEVDLPSGFTVVEGEADFFTGRLGRDEVVFEALSAPYSADWSGRLVASGRIVDADTEERQDELA